MEFPYYALYIRNDVKIRRHSGLTKVFNSVFHPVLFSQRRKVSHVRASYEKIVTGMRDSSF